MPVTCTNKSVSTLAIAAVLSVVAFGAHAAGTHGGGHGSSIGSSGEAADTVRTIKVIMTENAFDPETIAVAKGETVRFLISNAGEAVHEFNIGTPAMHIEHQKEMLKMLESGVLEFDRINHDAMKGGSDMAHDDPNSVLLEPGDSAEIVWTFDTEMSLEFACNVPGHYESGMVGEIGIETAHGSHES